ncbi:hypothetical protein Tco_0309744 [Tanacetum coccineum]
MFGGYFVARLAEHFRWITEESLRGLIVVVCDHTLIDMDELVRLHIYDRLGDVWAWVAPGLERQQVVAARATLADQEIPKEGVLADPAPAHAPTTHILLERMSSDQDRLSTWVVDCITQLMHQSGLAFPRFDERLVGSFPLSMRETEDICDASTSAAPHAQDQHDP